MLAIRKSNKKVEKSKANLLPCRIAHNGAVKADKRYWKTEINEGGTQTAYFRGRKLRARRIKVPKGYEGCLLNITDKTMTEPPNTDSDDLMGAQEDEEEASLQTRLAEQVSSFDEILVWKHEALPDPVEDPHVKGVEEWISFAEAIHSYEDSDTEPCN
ncbi:hypothetical protein LTS18_005233 [Coniosporium uncinatum]|uniref:Uncharacterized protein n=1 Tax=Coniosporium uncinatum TaxID=93489 RepID=A0ACC3D563_9PEZI|nr:hypothetical protein LTS18_005233 [Coniosporium uncinatum]